MKNIHGWVFTYNEIGKNWRAAKREHYTELFNGGPHYISSKSIDTLIELIEKTDGDKAKLKKLIK